MATSICANILEASRPLIEACGHELTVELPPEPVHLDADPTRLAQGFLNLLNNAAKYSDRGSRISVTAERHGTDVMINVKDNGIGIASEHHERVFGVFERLHGPGVYPGTGIGLAIVRKGIERMGGRVGVESELGAGSRFWLDLPTSANKL